MEITKDRLRQIIKEEYGRVIEALPGERMPVGLAPRPRAERTPAPPVEDDEPTYDEIDNQTVTAIARDALILVGEFLHTAPPRASIRPVVQDLFQNLSKLEIQKDVPEEEQTLKNQRASEALAAYLGKLDKEY